MASTGDQRTLGARFETQPNALNLIRLLMAATVVVWHSHSLARRGQLWGPAGTLLEQLPLDTFFTISGFLVTRSWRRHPSLGRYLLARALRLFPGLWACLVFTAFVLMPIAYWVAADQALTIGQQAWYVLANSGAHPALTPAEAATVHMNGYQWNLPLWSLTWEVYCYLLVAALGVLGLMSARVWRVLAGIAWACSVVWAAGGVPPDSAMSLAPAPRLFLMFSVGALLWFYADRLPMIPVLASMATLTIICAAFLPDYRLVAAPAVGYLALYAGITLGRWQRLRVKNDLSYGLYIYTAPLQQAMLLAGFATSWILFSCVSLVGGLLLAAASWFLVERPSLGLRDRRRHGESPSGAPAHVIV